MMNNSWQLWGAMFLIVAGGIATAIIIGWVLS
jgi:hypothetical protein